MRMIRIHADDQPRLRQRTEIRLREILTAREVIRHHAVGQELHARKPRDASDEVHKPRELPVVEKKRTMGDTTDQVITPIGKIDARSSHAGNYTTTKIYCGNQVPYWLRIVPITIRIKLAAFSSDPNAANLRTGQLHETTLEV